MSEDLACADLPVQGKTVCTTTKAFSPESFKPASDRNREQWSWLGMEGDAPGDGAVFTVRLPLALAEPSAQEAPPVVPSE